VSRHVLVNYVIVHCLDLRPQSRGLPSTLIHVIPRESIFIKRAQRFLKNARFHEMATIKCVCEIIPWYELLCEKKPFGIKPLGAFKDGANDGCHICSLLFGSLLLSSGYSGTRPVSPNCQCLDSGLVLLFGNLEESFVIIQVFCGGQQGAHQNRLALSTMAHNGKLETKHHSICFLTSYSRT
jgi:hypothetical protein